MFINLVWSFGRLSVRLWVAREAAPEEETTFTFGLKKDVSKFATTATNSQHVFNLSLQQKYFPQSTVLVKWLLFSS